MSTIPPYYSPEGSNDLFDSETGELIYSADKNTIWKDSTFEFIKEEIYKANAYRDLSNKRKLEKFISLGISSGKEFKINTPPPPSPDFLPKVYSALQREASFKVSDYKDFDDLIQNYKYKNPSFPDTL